MAEHGNRSCFKSRALWAWLLGIAIAVVAARIATTGLFWSTNFHPDEILIAQWTDQVRDVGYVTKQAYPGGWFQLFRVRLWLEDRAERRRRNWERHSSQDGAVNALMAESFSRRYDDFQVKAREVQDGRDFNAVLYVLAALFIFGACLEMGMRPLAAGVSTAFFLVSAGPIEFAHYCETDEGLVVALAAFAWIAARSIRIKSAPLALAACWVAGFAVSCKPTLLPVLLWCLTAPFAIMWQRGVSARRWWIWIPPMVVCGLALAYWGYAYGTPAMRMAPEWYFKSLRHMKAYTYAELSRNMGGCRSKWAPDVLRLANLRGEMAAFGWLPLAWGLFAWTFWLRRGFRAQLAGAPFTLPLFFPFLVFLCPFVRSQETLPIAVLVALGAGLPLEWWLRMRKDGGGHGGAMRVLCHAAVAAWGIAAFVSCAVNAASMASCFQYRDSRAEAQNWLDRSLPADMPVGFDAYVGQSARAVDCEAVELSGLPYKWEGCPTLPDGGGSLRYYVENVGFTGRMPVCDLKTGRVKREVRQNYADYMASVFPLKVWSVPQPSLRPSFGQPIVRLVGLGRPGDGTIDIPIGYERPILLLPDGRDLYDSFEANGLGANCALHTVGKRSTARVSFDLGPRWLVTRMLAGDQPVRIKREGLTTRKKDALQPGGAVAARLRPAFMARLFPKAWYFNQMRCRMRGDDQATVCASFLARSAADAARELRAGGDPNGALELLRVHGVTDGPAKVEAFLAASAAGVAPDDDWTSAAQDALRACEKAAKGGADSAKAGISLCGTPLEYADDFARVRVKDFKMAPGQRLPVFLPAGRYDVTISVRYSNTIPEELPLRLLPGQTANLEISRTKTGATHMVAHLDLATGTLLKLPGKIDDDSFHDFYANIEVRWDPLQRTMSAAEELRRALAR